MAPLIALCEGHLYNQIDVASYADTEMVILCGLQSTQDESEEVVSHLGDGSSAYPLRVGMTCLRLVRDYVAVQSRPPRRYCTWIVRTPWSSMASQFLRLDIPKELGSKLGNLTPIFQQDNVSIHTSRFTKGFLATHNIKTLPWPPKIPDLNIIENVCGGVLTRRVYANGRQFDKPADLISRSSWNGPALILST
jgi:hypothetical protein